MLNIDKPINPHSWKSHTESISLQCEKLLDDITASFDGLWNSRGWSSRTGIVDACFEPMGKVLDVMLKSTHCKNCEEKKNYMKQIK